MSESLHESPGLVLAHGQMRWAAVSLNARAAQQKSVWWRACNLKDLARDLLRAEENTDASTLFWISGHEAWEVAAGSLLVRERLLSEYHQLEGSEDKDTAIQALMCQQQCIKVVAFTNMIVSALADSAFAERAVEVRDRQQVTSS